MYDKCVRMLVGACFGAFIFLLRANEGSRKNTRIRDPPSGRFVPAGLPRETVAVPGARRRAAHLSNLPGDIPQKTRRTHVLHGTPTPPLTSLHRALHRMCSILRLDYTPNFRHMDTVEGGGRPKILRRARSAFNDVKLFRESVYR